MWTDKHRLIEMRSTRQEVFETFVTRKVVFFAVAVVFCLYDKLSIKHVYFNISFVILSFLSCKGS